jgi:hypothetical protein
MLMLLMIDRLLGDYRIDGISAHGLTHQVARLRKSQPPIGSCAVCSRGADG